MVQLDQLIRETSQMEPFLLDRAGGVGAGGGGEGVQT